MKKIRIMNRNYWYTKKVSKTRIFITTYLFMFFNKFNYKQGVATATPCFLLEIETILKIFEYQKLFLIFDNILPSYFNFARSRYYNIKFTCWKSFFYTFWIVRKTILFVPISFFKVRTFHNTKNKSLMKRWIAKINRLFKIFILISTFAVMYYLYLFLHKISIL